MAKITLDPMFHNMRGKTGDLVHYKWKGKDCCRIYVVPANPDTEAQRSNRKTFGDTSRSWKLLPDTVKNSYNKRALKHRTALSGFNLYVSDCMKVKMDASKVKTASELIKGSAPTSIRHGKDPLRISSICDRYSPDYAQNDRYFISESPPEIKKAS